MKTAKKVAFCLLSAVLSGSVLAAPVPALAPQAIPPEAMDAIDTVNQAVENGEVPFFDSRVLSIGLGALAGVLVYNLLPGGTIVSRSMPGAVGRAVRMTTITSNQFPMMTSAVIGALVGDYMYRKNTRMPSVSAQVMERISP